MSERIFFLRVLLDKSLSNRLLLLVIFADVNMLNFLTACFFGSDVKCFLCILFIKMEIFIVLLIVSSALLRH